MSIRTRLATTYAVLAVALLVLAMGAVYVLESRESHARLAADARSAALALLAASETNGGADDQSPAAGVSYLAARGESETLYLLHAGAGAPLVNRPAAEALTGVQDRTAARQSVRIAGRDYELAVEPARDGDRVAIAAVPADRVNEELRRLLELMLKVGAVGLVVTLGAAWLAARRALRPLQRIATLAARVSAGDLDARVGGFASHDEIARVADAIDAMLGRLQEAFVAQRRFVHDASHELRTPITIARGHLEVLLLQPNPAPDDVRAAIELAVSELDRMGRVVTSLLRLARIDEEGLGELSRVPVRELLEAAAERARPLGERSIAVTVDADADVELAVDREAIDQVLLNLVSNAVRHTRPGGRIAMEGRRRGGEIALTVTDDGEGIAPEALPTLFDRFTRADTARRRDTGGAGLGLAICRAIVEAHDGVIGAASEPGHGASFTVLLPIR